MLPGEFPLQDGTPALIWPLLPTDAEMLRDGFRRLSGESRQHRFLEVLGELDDSMIRRLVDSVDGVHHIALVLIVLPPEGEEGPAGVARLLQYPDDPATADIAVTVADDWQGRGIGTALVSALLKRRPAPVTRLRTVVGADNRRSLALLAGAGRMSAGLPERGVLDVTVELAAPARPARTPTARPVNPIPLPHHQPAHQRRPGGDTRAGQLSRILRHPWFCRSPRTRSRWQGQDRHCACNPPPGNESPRPDSS